jgi:hypothetical protein
LEAIDGQAESQRLRVLSLGFDEAATEQSIRDWKDWDRMGVRNWLKAWFPALDALRPFLEIDADIAWKGWTS